MSDNDATKAYENERFLNSWAARYQGGERGPRGMRSGYGHLLRSGSDVGGAADDHLVKAAGGSRRFCLHGWWSWNYGGDQSRRLGSRRGQCWGQHFTAL